MLKRIKEALGLNNAQWIGFKIGTVSGLLLFIIFGAPMAMIYGGYGTLMLMSKIMGGPVEPMILARIVIAVGIFLGLSSTALFFMLVGSLFGTGIGSAGSLISVKTKELKAVASELPFTSISEPVVQLSPETINIRKKVNSWTKVGALVGSVLFFVFGLIPGVLYGGATGIILVHRVFSFGEPSIYIVKGFYFIGSVLGAFGAIAVFLVIGAVMGTLLGYAYHKTVERVSTGRSVGTLNALKVKNQ